MSSARGLTGGTNDVNPQPLKCRVAPAAFTATALASTAVTVALPIPVQRLGAGGRAQVLEILGFDWDTTAAASAGNISQFQLTINIASRSSGTTIPLMGAADPYSIAHVSATYAPSQASYVISGSRNLTDSAGHGVLFGMDTLYIQAGFVALNSASGTFTGATNVLIWYRWKNVGFSEYVGMVTSS